MNDKNKADENANRKMVSTVSSNPRKLVDRQIVDEIRISSRSNNVVRDFTYNRLVQLNISCSAFGSCVFDDCDFVYLDMRHAWFVNCTFTNCVFYSNVMDCAIFYDCHFSECDMAECRGMRQAFFRAGDFKQCKLPPSFEAVTRIVPDGDIIGWKKLGDGCIAKLLIPADAKRSNAIGRKCRASKAFVLEIRDEHGTLLPIDAKVGSYHRGGFMYQQEQMVIPDAFHRDRWVECAPGIHFFLTEQEAKEYY